MRVCLCVLALWACAAAAATAGPPGGYSIHFGIDRAIGFGYGSGIHAKACCRDDCQPTFAPRYYPVAAAPYLPVSAAVSRPTPVRREMFDAPSPARATAPVDLPGPIDLEPVERLYAPPQAEGRPAPSPSPSDRP